jgi:acyl-CoA thioester hydrolase
VKPMESVSVIQPRYAETDQMGVVYHGNYITWFEVARSDFFKALGYSYRRLESEGVILPVIEVGCEYFKPALYDEPVEIKTTVKLFKGVRFGLSYRVYEKASGELLARGFSHHAFTDKDLKPVNIKKINPAVHQIILKAMEASQWKKDD